MKQETRASRGATAGLSNAFLEVREERFTSSEAPRQALHLANRFGLAPATAALLAELAYPVHDTWRARL